MPELTELGSPRVQAVAADMADPEGTAAIVDAHGAAYPDMAALILSAGVGSAGPIASYPIRRLDKTMSVNFRSVFVLIQNALPLLRAAAARASGRAPRSSYCPQSPASTPKKDWPPTVQLRPRVGHPRPVSNLPAPYSH